MFKKLTIIIFSACMFIPHVAAKSEQNINTIMKSYKSSTLKKDAEHLYKKINNFLLKYKNVPPEKFDDICKEYLSENMAAVKLLSEEDFKEKSKDSIVLYRGINEKQFADSFKKGIIYWPPSIRNIRGTGIYTTTSFECAKQYSDKSNPETIVKMLVPKTGIKVLKNEYLEKLKDIICKTHSTEFGMFSENNKENYIFDSASEFLNKKFGEVNKKIKKEHIDDPNKQLRLFSELLKQLKKGPIMVNRKRYFKESKAYVFYNSGLLTKLLGFDALCSMDYLSNFVGIKKEEYLIVNPKILSILND